MHDLHEADKILKLALEYAAKNGLKKVTRIILKLGEVMEHGEVINPDNLKFNIQILAESGIAKGAEVVIESAKINSWELVEIEGE